MQNLEKRVAALETAIAPADDLTIVRRFVSPGQLAIEIGRLRDDEGEIWDRKAGETEQELIGRATLEVRRNPWGVACLIGDARELPHADH